MHEGLGIRSTETIDEEEEGFSEVLAVGQNSSETPERSSHLKKGVKPIFACVGSLDDFAKTHPEYKNDKFRLEKAKNVDWGAGTASQNAQNFLHAGEGTYVISTIDDSNKFSENYGVCTGIIVAGIDKNTGKNISFMTHQISSPAYLRAGMFSFNEKLKNRLREFKERCEPQTIDAVIVGGAHSQGTYAYPATIDLLSMAAKNILGFEPVVINGPKLSTKPEDVSDDDSDDAYYDNEHRRLYFVRTKVNESARDFVSSDFFEEEAKRDEK